jgi:hypothetical protein
MGPEVSSPFSQNPTIRHCLSARSSDPLYAIFRTKVLYECANTGFNSVTPNYKVYSQCRGTDKDQKNGEVLSIEQNKRKVMKWGKCYVCPAHRDQQPMYGRSSVV